MALTIVRGRTVSTPPGTANKMSQVSGATTATSLNLTTATFAAPGGSYVFAASAWRPSSLADTCTFSGGGLTWSSLSFVGNPGFNQACGLGYAYVPLGSSVPISTVLTATFSTTALNRMLIAFCDTTDFGPGGIALDGTPVQGTGTTSTALNPGSLTPTVPLDFGVAVYANTSAAARTGTPPAGWTELFDFSVNSTNSLQVNVRTALVPDLTAQSPTETLSAAPTATVCALALFKTRTGPIDAGGLTNAVTIASTR